MSEDLYKIAEKENIAIEQWNFKPPLEAVYMTLPDGKPLIGLSHSLEKDRRYKRCVLAEEIGHYYTTVGNYLPVTLFHYKHRLDLSRAEYKAIKWAAEYLMPIDEIRKAFQDGLWEAWEFAERFDVTEQFVYFRMTFADVRELRRCG